MDERMRQRLVEALVGQQRPTHSHMGGYQPSVPQDNPVVDWYDDRSMIGKGMGGLMSGAGATTGALGLIEAFEGNPLAAAMLGLSGLGFGGIGGASLDLAKRDEDRAKMWENRFGTGNPNQGLPGTQSGPPYRR